MWVQRGRAVAGTTMRLRSHRMPDDDDANDDNDDDDDDNALSQIFNELNNVLLLRQPQQGSPQEGHVFAVPALPAAVD